MWKVVGGKEHDSGIDYWEQDGTIMTKEEAEQVNQSLMDKGIHAEGQNNLYKIFL